MNHCCAEPAGGSTASIARLLEERLDTSVNTAPEVVARHYEAAGSDRPGRRPLPPGGRRAAAGICASGSHGVPPARDLAGGAAPRRHPQPRGGGRDAAVPGVGHHRRSQLLGPGDRSRPMPAPASCANISATMPGSVSPWPASRSTTPTEARRRWAPAWPSGSWPSPGRTTTHARAARPGPAGVAPHLQGRDAEALEHTAGPSRSTIRSDIGAWPSASAPTTVWPPTCSPAGATSSRATSTGVSHMVAAVDLADHLDQPFNRVYALAFQTTCHWERGESAETLRVAEEARYLGEEQGFVFWAGLSGVWEGAERVVSLETTAPWRPCSRPGWSPARPATGAGARRSWPE